MAREEQEFTRGIIDSVIEVTDLMRNTAEVKNARVLGIEQVSTTVEHMGDKIPDIAKTAGELVVPGDQPSFFYALCRSSSELSTSKYFLALARASAISARRVSLLTSLILSR